MIPFIEVRRNGEYVNTVNFHVLHDNGYLGLWDIPSAVYDGSRIESMRVMRLNTRDAATLRDWAQRGDVDSPTLKLTDSHDYVEWEFRAVGWK